MKFFMKSDVLEQSNKAVTDFLGRKPVNNEERAIIVSYLLSPRTEDDRKRAVSSLETLLRVYVKREEHARTTQAKIVSTFERLVSSIKETQAKLSNSIVPVSPNPVSSGRPIPIDTLREMAKKPISFKHIGEKIRNACPMSGNEITTLLTSLNCTDVDVKLVANSSVADEYRAGFDFSANLGEIKFFGFYQPNLKMCSISASPLSWSNV